MVFTYSLSGESPYAPYLINSYWLHKFDENHFLITVEHGSWVVLSKEEFRLLRTHRAEEDPNLFNLLEEKGIIFTEKNLDDVYRMYRLRFHSLFQGIGLHIIVPTLRCNLKCLYCQASSKPLSMEGYDMSRKTAKTIVDFIFQSPSSYLTIEFQGGEPLVNFPIIKFIIRYVKQKNKSNHSNDEGWWIGKKAINFQIVSNFTLMNNEILNFIMKNKIRLCASLDGPKKLHDKNRPWFNGSSYEKVVYWINHIRNKEKYNFFTSALPTITRHSLPYAKEIVDEYLRLGFTHMRMRPLNTTGIAIKSWKNIGYTPEEFNAFWKDYIEYVISLNKKGVKIFDEDSGFMLRRIVTLKPSLYTCLGAPCGGCLLQTAYNQWGDIYTCDEARSYEVFKLGNVKENNYEEIFTSKNALNFIGLTSSVSLACNSCFLHPFCSPCLVNSYGSQGNLIPKIPIDFNCKIRRFQIETIFKKLIFSEEDKKIFLEWLRPKTFKT